MTLSSVHQLWSGTNKWEPLPDMQEARRHMSLVSFGNSIFAIGGYDGTKTLSSVERFDFNQGAWNHCYDLNSPWPFARSILAIISVTYWCGAGLSCSTGAYMLLAALMTVRVLQWSASPQDPLAASLWGTRWDMLFLARKSLIQAIDLKGGRHSHGPPLFGLLVCGGPQRSAHSDGWRHQEGVHLHLPQV